MSDELIKAKQKLLAKIENEKTVTPEVRAALAAVPREEFLPESARALAYRDAPLAIGEEQTISQPSLVAFMTSELKLKKSDRVLEVGTGCGYQTAILAKLAKEVFTVELRTALAEGAKKRLEQMGYTNIHYKVGDGSKGWIEKAPFDAIIVTAAAAEMPEPLYEQLRMGGRMVIPVGREHQDLFLIRKTPTGKESSEIFPVRFVPLISPT